MNTEQIDQLILTYIEKIAPESVETIRQRLVGADEVQVQTAFANLKALTTINNIDAVTTIVDKAFAKDIALTELTLPATVTSIDKSPFDGCESLATLTINATALTTLCNSTFCSNGI